MKTEDQELSLLNLMGGAAIERFDREFTKVVKNVMDPNTDPKAARTVTLTVTVKPNDDRQIGNLIIDCKAKVASARSLKTAIAMGTEGARAVAREITFPTTKSIEFPNVSSIDEKRKEQQQ